MKDFGHSSLGRLSKPSKSLTDLEGFHFSLTFFKKMRVFLCNLLAYADNRDIQHFVIPDFFTMRIGT